MAANVVSSRFYSRDVKVVARELIGTRIVSTIGGRRTSGIVVETEAYLSKQDSACHGYTGQTNRNASMFGRSGLAYVYAIHARYCFNIVTERIGKPAAVLIRAIRPESGITSMRARRQRDSVYELCSGPAKLCQALGIDLRMDGAELTCRRKLWLEKVGRRMKRHSIHVTRRIGVTSAEELPLRFVLRGSPYASGPKYLR